MVAKTSDPKGSSNFHKVWRIVNHGDEITLKWKEANVITNLKSKYFYNDESNFKGTFSIFLETQTLCSIIIMDKCESTCISID